MLAEEEPLLDNAEDGDSNASEAGSPQSKEGASLSKVGSLLSDLLYGLINAIVGIPTMISFAAIIFSVSPFKGSNFSPLAIWTFQF